MRALTEKRVGAKRRWGYLVWVVAGLVIAVPEITAAAGKGLPFTTISGMTGHIERHHNWVELIVVALIAFVIYSTTRLRPQTSSTSAAPADDQFVRTAGGRLTLQSKAPARERGQFDDDRAPLIFALCAVASLVVVAVATWAAANWWDDGKPHYHPAYVLYGLLGFFWLLVPSAVAFFSGNDVPYPTLFRTIGNLEDWLRGRPWPKELGPITAWIVSYVIFAGLLILLLHLAFYPFPDITKIINPTG